jgi:hypothetical protein
MQTTIQSTLVQQHRILFQLNVLSISQLTQMVDNQSRLVKLVNDLNSLHEELSTILLVYLVNFIQGVSVPATLMIH